MFVKNHMTPNPITIEPDTPIFEALSLMKKHRIKQLPVVEDGRLLGLVTERDLLTVSPSPATTLSIYELNYLLSKMTVKEVMIKSPARISPDATIEEAAVRAQVRLSAGHGGRKARRDHYGIRSL